MTPASIKIRRQPGMNARTITDGSEAIVSSSEADTSPLIAAASKQYVTPTRLKLQNTVTPSTVGGPPEDQASQGEASCQEQIEIAPKQPESKQDVKTSGAKSPASIKLGPRLTGGKSPAKAMSLMPRKSPSDASSKENVDAVKKVAPTGNAAKRNLGNVMQRGDRSKNSNAVQEKKGIPPPSQFLAAKISPLRSSARIKKQTSPRPEKGEGGAAAPPSRSPLPDIAKADLLSPCGMFLTPRTPNRLAAAAGATAPLTPSNFASDFGKSSTAEGIDASGVFAWLHSPTLGANGLFSPNGGLAQSLTNTPRGMYGFSCKTPHTPSTAANLASSSSQPAFFFDSQQSPSDREDKNGMICISPLASKKPSAVTSTPNPNEHVPSTPMSIDFTKVFATPRLPTPRLSKSSGSAMKQGIQTPVLSSMERNIIDEDLNAMLQLAEATPSGTRSIGFLSPLLTNSFRKVGGGQEDHIRPDENLSDLQLPVISGRVTSGFSPSLAARSSSSKGSLKGSQKRKAGDMDRSSQRHSYPQPPQPPHASMLHYRHQNGPRPQGGFYPHPPPGYPMSNFPPSNQHPNASSQHRQHKGQANAPGQPEKSKRKAAKNAKAVIKKAVADDTSSSTSLTPSPPSKKPRKSPSKPRRPKSKNALPDDPEERERLASAIRAVNKKNGGKNSEAAELAAAIMRGVTCRPSGKWVSSPCLNSLLQCHYL